MENHCLNYKTVHQHDCAVAPKMQDFINLINANLNNYFVYKFTGLMGLRVVYDLHFLSQNNFFECQATSAIRKPA